MASSSKNFHARSNSFPSSSHPSTLRVDEELNKLRILETSTASTSDSIYKGLSGLEDLYISVEDLLNLASTQQVLSQNGHEKCVEDLLDGSVRLLDVCENTKDMLVQLKEHIKGLQSALRRRKDDLNLQSRISSFLSFRKKMKKNVKNLITVFKRLDNKCQVQDLDSELISVIARIKEATSINVSIFQSLLTFLSASVSKPKWSLVSKLMQKEKVACEEKLANVNELVCVDVSLLSLCKSVANNENMQTAQESLDALDMTIEGLENSLENVFRHLIKSRASFLNVLSFA